MQTSFDKTLAKMMRIEILKECNQDLKDVKNYYVSHFNQPNNFDFSREKRKYELIISEQNKENINNNRITEFIKKFEVQINDN